MISKIENATFLCVTPKKWEMKDKGTSGVSYNALVYADKAVTFCKTDEEIYNRLKDKELIKGIAVISVEETSYNNVKGVTYRLLQFGESK